LRKLGGEESGRDDHIEVRPGRRPKELYDSKRGKRQIRSEEKTRRSSQRPHNIPVFREGKHLNKRIETIGKKPEANKVYLNWKELTNEK